MVVPAVAGGTVEVVVVAVRKAGTDAVQVHPTETAVDRTETPATIRIHAARGDAHGAGHGHRLRTGEVTVGMRVVGRGRASGIGHATATTTTATPEAAVTGIRSSAAVVVVVADERVTKIEEEEEEEKGNDTNNTILRQWR